MRYNPVDDDDEFIRLLFRSVFGLDTVSEDELWSFDDDLSKLKTSRYLSKSGTHVRLPKYNNIEMSESQEASKVNVLIPLHIMGISKPTGKSDILFPLFLLELIYSTHGHLNMYRQPFCLPIFLYLHAI